MATSAEIKNWLAANPNASDKLIRSAMDDYGVSTQQMADATGLGLNDVQKRYDAVAPNPVQQPTLQAPKLQPYQQNNPYLQSMADSIKSQVNDNLTRNVMPQISSGAQQVGGFGGSRQGVVEANALRDANGQAANALTGMYYGDYNNQMNRNLQQYGMDQSYNLGMGNLALGQQNSDRNFYSTQRGQDMQGVQLGANLFQQGTQGYLNQGQGMYNLGLTEQNAPWSVGNNFNNASSPYTGFGSTTQTNNGSAGAGFLGGAMGAAQMYNIYNKTP